MLMPISLEEQEVLCSNCYETIPMQKVDKHSQTCVTQTRPPSRASLISSMRASEIQDND
jgi:hypothetical protein